jgi:hypothetical protein
MRKGKKRKENLNERKNSKDREREEEINKLNTRRGKKDERVGKWAIEQCYD